MTFHKNFTSLLLLVISFFATNSFSFNLEEVADKIYVHFGIQEDANKINRGDISNIGFIVGDKSILVIDTGGTPSIGEALYKKINDISDLPISYVVITHSHPDHYFGTNVFINDSIDIIGNIVHKFTTECGKVGVYASPGDSSSETCSSSEGKAVRKCTPSDAVLNKSDNQE